MVMPHGWGYVQRGDRIPGDRGTTLETPELARMVAAGLLVSAFPIDSDVAEAKVIVVVPSQPTSTPPSAATVPNFQPMPHGVALPDAIPVPAPQPVDVQPVVREEFGAVEVVASAVVEPSVEVSVEPVVEPAPQPTADDAKSKTRGKSS